jgi:uncharacterized iron-regulated protein
MRACRFASTSRWRPQVIGLFFVAAFAQAPTHRIFDCRTQREISVERLAEELARRDAAFLGEEHDNAAGHKAYADLCDRLHKLRPDMVVSMEMFERDVQGVLDDYLRGRIDEATFLKHSRAWKTYAEDYRPQVELAKKHGLDVIAGNLPRPTAGKYTREAAPTAPLLPRSPDWPKDRYWELFTDTMKGHPGMEGPANAMMEGMYRAQCAKDEAMAESIADYLSRNPHRQPFVVHRNGNFHSDYGLGVAGRLSRKLPLLQSAVVSMVSAADVAKADLSKHWRKAHYLLVVPESAKRPSPTPPKSSGKEAAKSKDKVAPVKPTPPKQPPSTSPSRLIQ